MKRATILVLFATMGVLAAPAARADAVADSTRAIRALLTANQFAQAEARIRGWLAALPAGADTARGAALDLLVETFYNAGPWSQAQRDESAEAVKFKERVYGPDHPEVARTIHYYAFMLYRAGEWDEAEPLAWRALRIRERGPPDLGLVRSMNVVANVLEDKAEYERAERMYLRMEALADSLAGPESPQVANVWNSRAILYRKSGRFSESKAFYEKSLALRTKTLGPEHVDVGWSLNNYGNLLIDMGDGGAARVAHQRGLEIREKALGPDHPGIATGYNNLALACQISGDTTAALAYHKRALEIRRKVMKPGSPDIAQSLENTGTLLMMHGDLTAAEPLIEEAYDLMSKAHGPQHVRTAMAMINLAEFKRRSGDLAEAIRLYEEGLATRLTAQGPDHPEVAECLEGLAMARHQAGQDSAAFEDALRAEAIATRHLRGTARALEERAALIYAGKRVSGLDIALGLLRTLPQTPDRVRRAFEARVRSRAVVLDEMADRHHAVLASGDPATLALADSLREARDLLARLASAGRDPARIDQARARKERLEAALAQKSASFRDRLATTEAGADQVLAALPPKTALVAYTRYNDPDREGRQSYAAFVAQAGGPSRWIDLGPAEAMDSKARGWTASARQAPDPLRRARDEAECARRGEALRKASWDPVARAIGVAERVFIVPDGALHTVNLAALPASGGRYLVELDPLMQLLSAERDLVARHEPSAGGGVLAMGGPAFDDARALDEPETGTQLASLTPASASNGTQVFRGPSSTCADFKALRFEPLPAAGAEVADVAGLWRRQPRVDVLALDGAHASEAAFRRHASGRRIVHLATHGIFLGSECAPSSGTSALHQSPLLRSGVAFAGANRRGSEATRDDGILTAEEIASLDLSSAAWVVLSGCETGRGEIADDEGVLGMRRAFQVAGARTTIMSLWPVDDAATREWMKALHGAARQLGLDAARASREAARAVLAQRKAKRLATHPSTWGAFVAAGR